MQFSIAPGNSLGKVWDSHPVRCNADRPGTLWEHANGGIGSERVFRALIESVCLLRGQEFVLSTGARSDFYFDCKRAVLRGDALNLIAYQFLAAADRLPTAPDAISGLSIGADFLVAATIQLAAQKEHRMIAGCVVRKDRKEHGTGTFIENEQPPGTRVMVVDDVFTSGRSTALACERLMDVGNEIVGIVGLSDRKCREVWTTYRSRELHKLPVSTRLLISVTSPALNGDP